LLHAAASSGNPAIYHLNFLQAIVLGLIQGVFELFPLSSLGHTVLIPSWIGGSWATLVHQESSSESPYLAFIVGLHLANAIVLLLFFIKEWIRLIVGFVRTIIKRRIETDTERLAWLIVIATVPVGILGIVLEHTFRTLFAKPVAAAAFLTVNGVILFTGEWFRRRGESEPERLRDEEYRHERRGLVRIREDAFQSLDEESETRLVRQLSLWSAIWIGTSQSLALLAGISREGVAMVGGLYRGLSNENALRFAFLLSTPVIFAAGALKVPDLLGHLGNGIRGQVAAGGVAAVVASFLAIVFLTRYFKTRTLVPFAVYSLLFGVASVVRFGAF
jgi:undecaprenyl-diphosphatase